MTDDEIIAVVQAHKQGKKIECRVISMGEHGHWLSVTPRDYVPWDFGKFRYRVAPEPRKPREWSVHVTKDGMVLSYPADRESIRETIRVREVIE